MSNHIYLAHPIDHVQPANQLRIAELVGTAAAMITQLGGTVYTPGDAWGCPPNGGISDTIQKVNDHAVATSSAVLAIYPEGIESIGVPMEMQRAVDLGIPVVVIRGGEGLPKAALRIDGVTVYPEANVVEAARAAVAAAATGPLETTQVAKWSGTAGCGPRGGYIGDAGFDLTNASDEPVVITPGAVAQIPSGIAVEMPRGMWSIILGRSSTFGKLGLLVNPAVIDNGFRGPLYAVCRNIGMESVTVEPGQRVAQLVPMALTAEQIRWVEVEHLSESDRGLSGFGSSGA